MKKGFSKGKTTRGKKKKKNKNFEVMRKGNMVAIDIKS